MSEKLCENCINRKTMNCPNSSECYSTKNKPYFVPVNAEDKDKEIERLNNIINELEKKLLELRLTDIDGKTIVYRLLDKLQALKGDDK